MKIIKSLFCSAALFSATAGLAVAQDGESGFKLPEQCASGTAMESGGHAGMSADDGGEQTGVGMGMEGIDIESMTDAQRANMRSMMETMPAMHTGMMNEDPDIAFACAMIAHHQGAIDMAEVELEYGEDEAMRQLAQEIIEAQKTEIEEMTRWLAKNAN